MTVGYIGVAPLDNDGKPRCPRCWHPYELYAAGYRETGSVEGQRLQRRGTVLHCLDCGGHMEEPQHLTLARLTAAAERPRHSRIATRRFGRQETP